MLFRWSYVAIFYILVYPGQVKPIPASERTTTPPATKVKSIRTHVTDTVTGLPAKHVNVTLWKSDKFDMEKWHNGFHWNYEGYSWTREDGRAEFLLDRYGKAFTSGTYKFEYNIQYYYHGDFMNKEAFFPKIEIIFHVNDLEERYHIPLLLSPFGYTTYRGS